MVNDILFYLFACYFFRHSKLKYILVYSTHKGFEFTKFKQKVCDFDKAACIWKFVQRDFIASKLNAGCGGYLDKIC